MKMHSATQGPSGNVLLSKEDQNSLEVKNEGNVMNDRQSKILRTKECPLNLCALTYVTLSSRFQGHKAA